MSKSIIGFHYGPEADNFKKGIDDLRTWIDPLTDYVLNNDFPRGSQWAKVHERYGDTTPGTSESTGPVAPSGLAYEVKGFAVGVAEDHVKPGQEPAAGLAAANTGHRQRSVGQ